VCKTARQHSQGLPDRHIDSLENERPPPVDPKLGWSAFTRNAEGRCSTIRARWPAAPYQSVRNAQRTDDQTRRTRRGLFAILGRSDGNCTFRDFLTNDLRGPLSP